MAHLQTVTGISATNTVSEPVVSATTVVAITPTAGSGMILSFTCDDSNGPNTNTVSVSDDKGNVWTQQGTTMRAVTANQLLAVFYAKGVAGGATNVTVTTNVAASWRRVAISEYSNVGDISLVSTPKADAATVTAANGITTNSFTPVTGLLIYGVCLDVQQGGTLVVGTGYTLRGDVKPTTGVGAHLVTEDKTSAGGAVTATWTASVATDNYHAIALAVGLPVANAPFGFGNQILANKTMRSLRPAPFKPGQPR